MATSAAFLAHCAAVAVVAVATTSSHDVLRGVRLPANRTPTQLRAQSSGCESCGGQLLSRFGFEAGYINFNHGSYGAVPLTVMHHHHVLLDQVEAAPDKWFRTDHLPLQNTIRTRVANYVGAAPDDVVFVENASGGCNAFLRSYVRTLAPGAKILYLDSAYHMVKAVLALLNERHDLELVEVPVSADDIAAGPEGVLAAIGRVVEGHGGAGAFALGLICHITSVPAAIMPIERFVELLAGVPVFIDGAHAPGQIPLAVGGLRARHRRAALAANTSAGFAGAVAYVGNMHKWAFAPKGTAFLWASPEFQSVMIPPTLSGGAHDFQASFAATGTRDYTAFCSCGAGLDFRATLGTEDALLAYGHSLALWAGEHLSRTWGTEVMEPAGMTGWMTNVRLPTDDADEVAEVASLLLDEDNTFVVFFGMGGRQWTRLSAQLYLDERDFELLGERVLQLLGGVRAERRRCGHPGCSKGRRHARRSGATLRAHELAGPAHSRGDE